MDIARPELASSQVVECAAYSSPVRTPGTLTGTGACSGFSPSSSFLARVTLEGGETGSAVPDSNAHRSAGEVAAAISNSAVKLMAEYTGRGPTKARTTLSGSWLFITVEDTLTKGEKKLAANGQEDVVLQTRKHFQHIMREDLEASVMKHTGRRVLAFMSDNHIDPDVAVEAFMLEPDGDIVAAAPAD